MIGKKSTAMELPIKSPPKLDDFPLRV